MLPFVLRIQCALVLDQNCLGRHSHFERHPTELPMEMIRLRVSSYQRIRCVIISRNARHRKIVGVMNSVRPSGKLKKTLKET